MFQRAPPAEIPAAHSTISPQELELGIAAPTHLQQGGFSLPQTMGDRCSHWAPLLSWTSLVPSCYSLLIPSAFHFPFPESPCCCQSDMPGLSPFCIWGCVQFLLTWQYVKYHLTQKSVGMLFATDRHSIFLYYQILRFTYYLYPFASHEVIFTFVTH